MAQSIATQDHDQGIASVVMSGLRAATGRAAGSLSASFREVRGRLDSRIGSEIDVDMLASKFDVDAKGAADGSVGQPPAAEQEATGVQREVIAHFRALQRRAQAKAASMADRLAELGNGVDVSRAIAEIREIPARCESDLLRLASQQRAEIERAREDAAQRLQDQQDDESGIVVLQPTSRSVLTYALLAVFTIFGAAFLLTNLAFQGLTTPANWALAVASAVVLFPFVVSREIHRYAMPEPAEHRIMAGLGIVFSVIFVIALSVFTAAFVSAAIAGENPGAQDILNTFASSSAGIGLAPQGWVAAAITIVAGMLAIGIGKNSAEPSPERQIRVNHSKAGVDPVQSVGDRIRKKYNKIVDKADKKVSAEADAVRKSIGRFVRAVDQNKSIPGEIEDYCVILEDACNIVLDRYRAANRANRSTDEPASFTSHVCFRPEGDQCKDHFERAEALRAEFRQELAELDREALKARQKLRDLNSRALSAVDGFGSGNTYEDELI